MRAARAVQSQIVLFTRKDHFNAIINHIQVGDHRPHMHVRDCFSRVCLMLFLDFVEYIERSCQPQ